ncbi:unnamed protein product [Brassica oleracea var. botrytis]|uniref:Transposase MuDR plant domain-containing protein n=2 Tax=Brassica oleracea TaxID=3712 RepID=A0A0D3DKX1_BRAOL|nr:unnamed protein product [Brassica oleracea]
MDYSSTNIHFDYDEHYAKSVDDYEWIPSDGRLYVISFKTSSLDEITYSFLKERICKKMTIYPCTKSLNLSYIPLVVEPKRQSYILDDEDVFVYLTSVDKEERRSILHVEVIQEMEIVPITEQQSRVEKESSYGGKYSELANGLPEVEGNPGALTLFTPIEEAERYLEGIEQVENVVNGEADEGGIGLDNRDSVKFFLGIGAISDYVKLSRVAKEIPVVTEWEDGLGVEMFQEFPSKVDVKDLIDRGSQQNIFGISIVNSDKSQYVVKCRGADEGCKWVVRATKIRNSKAFSIRTYIKMHSCSRATSSTEIKRKATPRCVAV